MTDDRRSGIALIAGSVGGIVTMAVHPSGAVSATGAQVAHLAVVSAAAHSLAMVSVVIVFLGACGLAKSIASAGWIAFAGLVTYGFACVAVLIATAISGFVVPDILRHMVGDVPANSRLWEIVVTGIFQINQAFARIYSVAVSAAILLWSVSVLRHGGLGRGVAIYGCIFAPVIVVLIAIGHLRLDVHGMAVVVLSQAIWFVVAGVDLIRMRNRASRTAK